MVERVSALAEHYRPGHYGESGEPGVTLRDVPDLVLHQIAAWPKTLDEIGQHAAQLIGAESAPAPGQSSNGSNGTLLRVEPLKWWLLGAVAPELDAEKGCTLDLSHARTHIQISGPDAATFLNRHLPLDLRESAFPMGAVGSSAIHHVGVTLWHSETGFELFIPRGFALTLWELFSQSAEQFGLEVV